MEKKKKEKLVGNLTIVCIVETYLIAKGGKKKGGQIRLKFTEVPMK